MGLKPEHLLDRNVGLLRDIERRTVKDDIAEKIAALIASGVLSVGDELPGERELASALSVSRQTVSSAIQKLAARGILEVSHGLRTRVAKNELYDFPIGTASRLNMEIYDVHDVHAARLLIEQKVVGDAAERIHDETLEALSRSLIMQAKCVNNPVKFLICDREFHVMIYRECGNSLMADIVTDLYTYMMEYRRLAMAQFGAIEDSYADHQAIFAALEKRDRLAAVSAFASHEVRIYQSTQKLLEENYE